MKKLLVLFAVCFWAIPVWGATYDITMTVDNGYGLYAGNASGISYIGGDKDWTSIDAYSYDFNTGDYVYVFAWDWGYAEGFIGQFISQDSNFDSFYTTTTGGWEVMTPSLQNTRQTDAIPSASAIAAAILNAQWSTVLYSTSQSRWASTTSFPGITDDAVALWGAVPEAAPFYGPSFIFRHVIEGETATVTTVPEPSTILLLSLGFAGLAWCGLKQRLPKK